MLPGEGESALQLAFLLLQRRQSLGDLRGDDRLTGCRKLTARLLQFRLGPQGATAPGGKLLTQRLEHRRQFGERLAIRPFVR